MDYSALADKIRNNVSSLEQAIARVEAISLDSVWAGEAHDEMTSNLDTTLSSLKSQADYSVKLANALDSLQKYKSNRESINDLYSKVNRTPKTEENASAIQSYESQISSLKSENSSLKTSIQSAIGSVPYVSSQMSLVTYEPSKDYSDFVVDIDEMLALFQSGKLTKISDSNGSSNSLYDFYSAEEVEGVISDIKQNYSGRDAAVNCALGVMQMAANVGMKLDYDFGGGHSAVTSLGQVATGTDCSSFASWAINQGASSTFGTVTTASLVSVGDKTSYENAKKGDILVYNNGSNGHVVMVVDNDPETQQFLVVEASGSKTGVVMQTRSYSSLYSQNYQARDLTKIYDN